MSDPTAVARARVDDLLQRLSHVNLQVVVVAPPDGPRRVAQSRARAAAVAAGRGELFEQSVAAARETVIRAFSRGGFSGTWAATDWSISVTRPVDRVAAAAAFEEAAMAEVVEDLVDQETLDILRSSSEELIRSTELPSPGSLSSFGRSTVQGNVGATQRAIMAVSVIVGIGLSLVVGLGVGLVAIAVGAALAGLRGSARPST
jgi:hypothetical protein